jgi:hypothetical protein
VGGDGHRTFTDDNGRRDELRKPGVRCERVGGPIATVSGLRPQFARPEGAGRDLKVSPASFPRIDGATQRARDSDRRRILEDELRLEEERLARLQSDFNGGQPATAGDETRGSPRYLERVQRLQQTIERTQNNVAALRRELALTRT